MAGPARLQQFAVDVQRSSRDYRFLAPAARRGPRVWRPLVIVDTVSDTFGGDENNHGQVRQYIQTALGEFARALDASVIATAHPSRAGMMKDGSGNSGSTGGMPASLAPVIAHPQPDKDEHGEILEPADPYARVLQRKKANYALREDEIQLFWKEGVFHIKQSTGGILGEIDRQPLRAGFSRSARCHDFREPGGFVQQSRRQLCPGSVYAAPRSRRL